jgi:hypothetical protein
VGGDDNYLVNYDNLAQKCILVLLNNSGVNATCTWLCDRVGSLVYNTAVYVFTKCWM